MYGNDPNQQQQYNQGYNYNQIGQTGQPQDPNQQYQQQQYQQPQQPVNGSYQQQYPQQVPEQVQMQVQAPPSSGLIEKPNDPIAAQEISDQMKFVRKVYVILAIQLSVTASWIAVVQSSESLRKSIYNEFLWLTITCCVLSIVLMCAIICCFGRTYPVNMIMLGAFTLCESWMVGGFTAQYKEKVVIMAGLATALVTIALTVYAMRTKVQIEVFAAMAFVVYLAMFPLMIISLVIGTGALYTLYCCLGLIFYSLYLIIDTIIICGKEKHNGVAMDHNDYVIGALMLYLDIIMIFIYILRLLGDK